MEIIVGSIFAYILPEWHKQLSGVVLDKVHNDWHIVLQLRLCISCNGHLWFQNVIMWGSILSLKFVGSSYRHIWSSASIIILMFWRLDHHLMVAGCLVTEIRIALSRNSWNTRSFKIYGSYLFCMKYSVAHSLKPRSWNTDDTSLRKFSSPPSPSIVIQSKGQPGPGLMTSLKVSISSMSISCSQRIR